MKAQYIHNLGIDDQLAMVKNGNTYYYHKDGLGSITKISDSTGSVVQSYEYDSFGNIKSVLDPNFIQPYTFTGREYDPETGMYHYRLRTFDSKTGTFTQKDPIGFAGGDTNLYRYVGNDPVNKIDPLGLDGINVSYQGYPIDTGYGFTLPLGHSAVIAVDRNTGTTKYYEYGRYDEAKFGLVRNQKVPNLVMENGVPTADSLLSLFKYISKHYGKNSPIDATYYFDADYQNIIDFASKRMRDKKRAPYNKLNNNCKTFAKDAINEGRK